MPEEIVGNILNTELLSLLIRGIFFFLIALFLITLIYVIYDHFSGEEEEELRDKPDGS